MLKVYSPFPSLEYEREDDFLIVSRVIDRVQLDAKLDGGRIELPAGDDFDGNEIFIQNSAPVSAEIILDARPAFRRDAA